MSRILHRAILVTALGSGLAACGSNNSSSPAPPAPPPVVVAPQENQFGAAFGVAFRASPTSTPVSPVDGDIVPLSLTTNPVNLVG